MWHEGKGSIPIVTICMANWIGWQQTNNVKVACKGGLRMKYDQSHATTHGLLTLYSLLCQSTVGALAGIMLGNAENEACRSIVFMYANVYNESLNGILKGFPPPP